MRRFHADLPVQLLRLLALIAVVTAVASPLIHDYRDWNWAESYYLCLVVGLLALSLRKLPPTDGERPHAALQWLVFLAVLAWRLSRVEHISVWLDEHYQIEVVRHELTVSSGGHQHQAPFGMAITALVHYLIPDSIPAMRFPPILFSSLTALLVFRMAFALIRSELTALLFTWLYASHCYVVHFGTEERPISLGLFSLLLTLELMLPLLRGSTEKPRAIPVFVAATLCVLSLGLQPPFAFGSMVLALLLVSIGKRNLRETALAVAPLVVAVVLFLPIQWYIVELAPPRFGKLGRATSVGLLSALHNPQTFDVALRLYLRPLAGALLAAAAAAAVQLGIRRGPRVMVRSLIDNSVLLLAAVVFLVGTSVFFVIGIDWMLMEYYLVFAWPLLLIALAQLLSLIELPRWLPRSLFMLALGGILALQTAGFYEDPWRGSAYERDTSDFKSLYAQILADGRPTAVQPLCIDNGQGFCPDYLVGADFYLGEADAVDYVGKLRRQETLAQWLRQSYYGFPAPERMALVFCHGWPGIALPELPIPSPGLTVHHYSELTLIVVDGPDTRRRLVSLLEEVRRAYRQEHPDLPWRLYPALIWGHLGLGEREQARALFRELQPPRETDIYEMLPFLAADFPELAAKK